MTLVGDSVHVSPAGLEAETVRLAVPLPVADTVMVEVPVPPGLIWAGDTVLAVIAVIVNPTVTVTGTFTVWVRVPLVPVIVTVKLCAVEQPPAVRVEVFGVGRVTLAGDIVAVQPAGVVEVMVRAMVPVKPLAAFAVIVEVPVFGAVTLMLEGLAVRLKSVTWKRMLAVV